MISNRKRPNERDVKRNNQRSGHAIARPAAIRNTIKSNVLAMAAILRRTVNSTSCPSLLGDLGVSAVD